MLGGVGVGLFLYFRPSAIDAPNIESKQRYYISEMRNGLYRYPDATGMANGAVITLQTRDVSYCVFDDDFKHFRIIFVRGNERTEMVFIVTSIKRGRGRLDATVQHIYDGDIRTYSITTTEDKIVLTSTAVYKITVGHNEFAPSMVEVVGRPNTVVLMFSRETPTYLKGVV